MSGAGTGDANPVITMTVSDRMLQQIVTAAVAEATQGLATEASVFEVHDRLAAGDDRMADIERGIAKNNSETSATLKASKEMLEAFDFAKRGLAFIGACAAFIGRVVTWVIKIGLPLGTVYAAIKGLKWPWTK